MFAKILQSIAQPRLAEVLKANPYHDAAGLFSSKDSANSSSHWSRFGSPGRKARILSSRAKFDKLFERDKEALDKNGLHVNLDADQFHRATGGKVTLTEFVKTMTGRTKDLGKITVTFTGTKGKQSEGISIIARNTEIHGSRVSKYMRTFYPNKKDVHHDYWEIHEEDRGKGAVKKFFRAGTDMYKRMGYDTVSVYANIDAGAYAWSKYGFKYADSDQRKYNADSIKTKLKQLESHPDVFNEIKAGIKAKKTSEVAKEIDMLHHILDSESLYSVHHLSDLKTPHLDRLAKPKVFLEDSMTDKQVTAVQHLMNSNGWDGVLDLHDPVSMARMQKYTGKKKKKS